MAKSSHQKQKLLYLARFLLTHTDEDHPASMEELLCYLKNNGISAERKSLYDDMEQLRLFGMDVICRKGRGGGYFIGQREFELSEVKLLVDAVQSARFLTRKKSEGLIRKLEKMTSRHEAKDLSHTVFVSNRIKTANETVYRNVDVIGRAISSDQKIRFRYFDWAPGGEKKYRKDGAFYLVSPYHLVWEDENYYLIAVDSQTGEKRHYRVDKMNSVEEDPGQREGKELFSDFDPALYEKKLFGMYQGEETRVTLWMEEDVVSVMLDRFGRDLVFYKSGSGYEVTLPVFLSPNFYAWLTGFGKRVKILSPVSAKAAFCELLKDAISANLG